MALRVACGAWDNREIGSSNWPQVFAMPAKLDFNVFICV
jgi:hypothetical protein